MEVDGEELIPILKRIRLPEGWLQTQRLVCCVFVDFWSALGLWGICILGVGDALGMTTFILFWFLWREKSMANWWMSFFKKTELMLGIIFLLRRADGERPTLRSCKPRGELGSNSFFFPNVCCINFTAGSGPNKRITSPRASFCVGRWESGWGYGKRRNRVLNTSIPGRLC